jgi:two-component system response regulator
VLEIVHDGEQALDFLLRRDAYRDIETPTPQLVLLDLNLPKLSGREVIRQIRANEALKHLPLVVFTTSHAEEDVLESYRVGCNSYLLKPNRFDQFVATMKQLTSYWLSAVLLPEA